MLDQVLENRKVSLGNSIKGSPGNTKFKLGSTKLSTGNLIVSPGNKKLRLGNTKVPSSGNSCSNKLSSANTRAILKSSKLPRPLFRTPEHTFPGDMATSRGIQLQYAVDTHTGHVRVI